MCEPYNIAQLHQDPLRFWPDVLGNILACLETLRYISLRDFATLYLVCMNVIPIFVNVIPIHYIAKFVAK